MFLFRSQLLSRATFDRDVFEACAADSPRRDQGEPEVVLVHTVRNPSAIGTAAYVPMRSGSRQMDLGDEPLADRDFDEWADTALRVWPELSDAVLAGSAVS